jgi:Co/Zn/Cd efflux system component
VSDLHLWAIGPDVYAAIVVIVAHAAATPEDYKARIPADLGLGHITIEVHEGGKPGSGRDRSRAAPAT